MLSLLNSTTVFIVSYLRIAGKHADKTLNGIVYSLKTLSGTFYGSAIIY